ncbi:Ribonuclease MRP protein subunit SNM1 [Nakaseomyces bracarensis]|uniref:Ribonuclease MRP protein subunit SNM1 n=1 Tax=Nakaseomyces bracarensis TaxID=273131 RepID=A0ABR4NQV9_9SACH
MNRDQKIKFRDRQIKQKYELVHMLPSLGVKELSGLYLKNFFNCTKRYHYKLSDYVKEPDQKFCGECGYIQVPTHSVKIETIQVEQDRQTVIKFTCLMCKHTYNETIEVKTKKSTPKPTLDPEAKSHQINKNTNSAKKRAKLRKQNSLTSMLSRKDQEKKNVKKSSSMLSLESFMKK